MRIASIWVRVRVRVRVRVLVRVGVRVWVRVKPLVRKRATENRTCRIDCFLLSLRCCRSIVAYQI